MRYKKILLGVIAGVLCLGILNGCSGYSHDLVRMVEKLEGLC